MYREFKLPFFFLKITFFIDRTQTAWSKWAMFKIDVSFLNGGDN